MSENLSLFTELNDDKFIVYIPGGVCQKESFYSKENFGARFSDHYSDATLFNSRGDGLAAIKRIAWSLPKSARRTIQCVEIWRYKQQQRS